MTKFFLGKHGETKENVQKDGKILDDKVSFRGNTGKHWENMGKREKTCKNKGNQWMTKF